MDGRDGDGGNQAFLLFASTRANRLILALHAATFFPMKTHEKDRKMDIQEMARAHAEAAIAVLVEIMADKDAPAGVRVSAAKAILERGLGKPGTQPKKKPREAPVTRFERVIIDPREPGVETPAPIDAPDSRSCRGSIRPVCRWPPATEHPRLGQQVETQAQRAPPAVGEFSDYTMTICGLGS